MGKKKKNNYSCKHKFSGMFPFLKKVVSVCQNLNIGDCVNYGALECFHMNNYQKELCKRE